MAAAERADGVIQEGKTTSVCLYSIIPLNICEVVYYCIRDFNAWYQWGRVGWDGCRMVFFTIREFSIGCQRGEAGDLWG